MVNISRRMRTVETVAFALRCSARPHPRLLRTAGLVGPAAPVPQVRGAGALETRRSPRNAPRRGKRRATHAPPAPGFCRSRKRLPRKKDAASTRVTGASRRATNRLRMPAWSGQPRMSSFGTLILDFRITCVGRKRRQLLEEECSLQIGASNNEMKTRESVCSCRETFKCQDR